MQPRPRNRQSERSAGSARSAFRGWRKGGFRVARGMTKKAAALLGSLALVSVAFAQGPFDPSNFQTPRRGAMINMNEDDDGPYVRLEGGGFVNEDLVKTAREVASHSTGTPEWRNPKGFEKDVFTFTRVVFKTGVDRWRGLRLGWWVDFPDADLNLSYRLQQLTSMRVDPDGKVIKLSDPELYEYPLIYMEHPGYMRLKEDEVAKLRRYFLAGGALLVVDFWSQSDWDGFEGQMKRVLPERNWTELTMDHPIFNAIFTLKGPMQRLQVPTMQFWNQDHTPDNPVGPLQWRSRGEGSETMHTRAWLDDKGRIMILAFWNSDLSDGWEREGENDAYFRVFSEKVSYPLGINIIYHLMTH